MVDWDLAVSLGSRIAGDGPAVTARRGRRRWSPSCAPARTGPPGWCASSPGWSPPSAPRRSWWSTGRAGSQANADGFADGPRAGRSTSSPRRRARPTGLSPGDRLPGHRRRGRRLLLGFLGRQGARPVRPVLSRPARPAAAGRAQHRARRARARRRPARLPALGVPARGDPPGAVHRRAVDARPPARRDAAPLADTVEPHARLLDDVVKRVVEARPRRRRQPGRR